MTWKPIERQSLRKPVGNEPRVLLSTFSYGRPGSDVRQWRLMISFRAPPAWLSTKGSVEVCQGSAEHAGMLRLRPIKAPKGFSFMLAGGKNGPVTCQIRLPTWLASMEVKRRPEECLCTFSEVEAVITLPAWAIEETIVPIPEAKVTDSVIEIQKLISSFGHPLPAGEPDPPAVQRRPLPEAKAAPEAYGIKPRADDQIIASFETVRDWAERHRVKMHTADDLPLVNAVRKRSKLPPYVMTPPAKAGGL